MNRIDLAIIEPGGFFEEFVDRESLLACTECHGLRQREQQKRNQETAFVSTHGMSASFRPLGRHILLLCNGSLRQSGRSEWKTARSRSPLLARRGGCAIKKSRASDQNRADGVVVQSLFHGS